MLAIETASNCSSIVANLLPVSIQYNGPIALGGKRYWNPQSYTRQATSALSSSSLRSGIRKDRRKEYQTAYFRGRKLQGLRLELPSQYQGHILHKTSRKPARSQISAESEFTSNNGTPSLDAAKIVDELHAAQNGGDDDFEEEDSEGEEDPYRRMLKRQQRQQQKSMQSHGRTNSPGDQDQSDLTAEEGEEEVGVLEAQSTFDHVVVWGHEHVPDDEDVYVKGIQEWIDFAEIVSD